MKAKPSYEECRLKRVEENKKRMEALNLPMLCQALRKKPSIEPSHVPPSLLFFDHIYINFIFLVVNTADFVFAQSTGETSETSYSEETRGCRLEALQSRSQQARPCLQWSELTISLPLYINI